MREILFRGWDEKNKEMVDNINLLFSNHLNDCFEEYEECGLKIMQYTGLKDRNGKEIYEGDVLDHPMQGKRVVYYPFNERVASYGLREISTGMCSTLQDSHRVYEIIGNIYENPELLKE